MKGWRNLAIHEVCDVISGQSPKGSAYNVEGDGLPFYQGKKEFGKKYIRAPKQWTREVTKEAKEGDILMSVRAPVGPINFTMQRICIGRGLAAIRARETIDREFLFYALLFKQSEIRGDEGAVFPSINRKQIQAIRIPAPPIREQERIVAILDEAFASLDTAITNTEKNLGNAQELFESYLSSVFDQSDEGWTHSSVKSLVADEVLDKPLDGNHGEIHPKKSDFVNSGVPFLMAKDLGCGSVNQTSCYFISKKQASELRKGFAKDGDILLSHKGTVGRCAVLKTNNPFVVLTPQLTYYRIRKKSKLFNRFLYYYFKSPRFLSTLNHIAGAGSTRAYIGITRQLDLPISFPTLENQKLLAGKFDELMVESRRLQVIYQKKLSSLTELKQSLLQKAFSGELAADRAKCEVESAIA